MAFQMSQTQIDAINQQNKKRQQASNFLRIAFFIILFSDVLFGIDKILGVPTIVIALILMFSRVFIVNKLFGRPQQVPMQHGFQPGFQGQPGYQDPQGFQGQQGYQNPQAQPYMYDVAPEKTDDPTVVADIKFCENCGKQNAAGARYCETCGDKIWD